MRLIANSSEPIVSLGDALLFPARTRSTNSEIFRNDQVAYFVVFALSNYAFKISNHHNIFYIVDFIDEFYLA